MRDEETHAVGRRDQATKPTTPTRRGGHNVCGSETARLLPTLGEHSRASFIKPIGEVGSRPKRLFQGIDICKTMLFVRRENAGRTLQAEQAFETGWTGLEDEKRAGGERCSDGSILDASLT
jgi:hypothetical protein